MRFPGGHESHPAADVYDLLEGEELDDLVASVKGRGLDPGMEIDRVVERVPGKKKGERATERKLVIDGRNRAIACERAGIKPRFRDHRMIDETTAEGIGNIYDFVESRNSHRRHLTTGQRARAAALLARMRPARPGRPPKDAAKRRNTGGSAAISLDTAARRHSVDERAVRRAKTVIDNAHPDVDRALARGRLSLDAAEELSKSPRALQAKLLDSGLRERIEKKDVTKNDVRGWARKVEKAAVTEALKNEPPPLPMGPFRVIVSDPPWPYEARADDVTQRAQITYPPMPIEAICALDVASLAHPDGCVLWLWTTNAFMREAYVVLEAWGFKDKTILTWVKDRIGAGHYLRNTTEHCILAVRGSPIINGERERTDMRGELREHSRKPDTFYELVERACPGSKVEMFARTPRPGWGRWGAEPEKFEPEKQTRLPR